MAETPQRVRQLTPLPEALDMLREAALPVAPRGIGLDLALGRTLAESPVPERAVVSGATAARDGWAVRSELVADAGSYTPVPVAAQWVDAGAMLPDDADAVLPPDAVAETGGIQEALCAAAPGEGVLRALDGGASKALRPAGSALRAIDVAALRACGIRQVQVREPLVAIVSVNREVNAPDDTTAPLLAAAAEAAGTRAHLMRAASGAGALESALLDGAFDAVVTIGGTGQGRGDRTVAIVGSYGEIFFHGLAVRPGETTAFARVGGRSILMLPGRLDEALGAWLLIGRELMTGLTGLESVERPPPARLARKIVSTIGLTEAVLVRCSNDEAHPVGGGLSAAHSLAQADAWVLVPANSEGFAAGATIELRPLP